jgi:hypothetical protein
VSTVEESTERPADPDRQAAVAAWLRLHVVEFEGDVPTVLLRMLEAAERWERERPEKDQFADRGAWWSAFEDWMRVRGDEACGLVWELVGNVSYFEDGERP